MFYKQRRIGICRNRYLEYTGTPISNSMTELYTLMHYLQAGLLKDVGIQHFDEWAADFGEVVTDFVIPTISAIRIAPPRQSNLSFSCLYAFALS